MKVEFLKLPKPSVRCRMKWFGNLQRPRITNRQAIDEALARWRREYHLSEEQAARVYHDIGTIFTRPTDSVAEIADHQPARNRVMNSDDGTRFLAVQERIAKSQPRRVRAHAH